MRITHVIERLDTGGAQALLAQLLPAMAECPGAEVSVVVYQSVADSAVEQRLREAENVRFVNLDLKKTRGFSPVFRLVSEVRRADIVHAHLFPALYHVAGASVISGTPMVYTEHGMTNRRREHRLYRPMERMVYGFCRKLIAISAGAAAALEEWLGMERGSVEVVANGINASEFELERPHASQWPLIFGREGKAIVMAARFSSAKDHSTLIRAMRQVEDDSAFLALAGEGETRRDMERLADECGVGRRVVFLGDRDDVPRLLSAAEVGVLSTHREGMSLSVLEMMASGVPLIATDVEGMSSLTQDAAVLVAEGDADALAAAINGLIAGNAREDTAMRDHRRQIARQYDIRRTAEEYMSLYERILNGKADDALT